MAYINGKEILFSANVSGGAATTRLPIASGDRITLQDNTIYIADETEPISLLVIDYPTNDFICSLIFKIVDSGEFEIALPMSRYIGGAPDFKNGETWELNIHNGIIASGKVVSE